MDLSNRRIEHILRTYGVEQRYRPLKKEAEAQPTQQMDRVTLSRLGQSIRLALSRVHATPDVRQDKVRELRAQIDQGVYRPPAEEIAEALLEPGRGDRV